MKPKAGMRRQMQVGFDGTKDADGQAKGSAVVRLVRRNAYELVGLRRPQWSPMLEWKLT
jgi:hypothetical protein